MNKIMNNIYSGIMGLVVGDALGVPVEFKLRDTFTVTDMIGGGTHHQPPGTWSDDSSMTLATLASIVLSGKIDLPSIMTNFVQWKNNGKFTPYGEIFDIGNTTRSAIDRYIRGMDVTKCGKSEEYHNGNGSLMRILPVSMAYHYHIANEDDIANVSALTHAHKISIEACLLYSRIVDELLKEVEKYKIDFLSRKINDEKKSLIVKEGLKGIKRSSGFWRLVNIQELDRKEIKSSGYVINTLEAALWCFLKTDSYRDCVLTAVNLGDDTDTTAAVAGGLAGIWYGIGGNNGIPKDWISMIPLKDDIRSLCQNFESLIRARKGK